VSHHKPELYENAQFPNIVVNLKFRAVPTHDYLVWVIIYNQRDATLNLENKKMRVIRLMLKIRNNVCIHNIML
jgi:hypothetical protein